MKPLVAIVGRPNVGKSTLFNRIVGHRLALVEDQPGVTRDRHYADVTWDGRAFTLADTGGFVPSGDDVLLADVRQQAELAIEESDVVIWLVDGRAGLTAADHDVAKLLRRSGRPIFVGVNKVDVPERAPTYLADFHRLGFPELYAISAEHGHGLGSFLEAVTARWPPTPEVEAPEAEPDPSRIRLAIIGRPNVGKSTLVNALLGKPRMVASELPGTTRDSIDSELPWKDRTFILTDTAGIRRKSTIRQKLEKVSVLSALRALDRSDIAALLLDATELGVDQDARLASLVEERGRALIIVVNKWDLAKKAHKTEDEFRTYLKDRLKFMAYAPILFTAAKDGFRVTKLLEVAAQLTDEFHFKASTPQLNKLLARIVDSNPAPIAQGKPLRLFFIRQVRTAPPTFAVFCNRPTQIPESYRRYVVNRMREAFRIKVPIHLVFKDRPGEEKRNARKRRN